ncbi:glycoside hydrolase superfamily, partial [Amylostereum chailletii]
FHATPVHAASTWNRELIRARSFAICGEFRAKGVHGYLGPVVTMARYVGGGTNFEGFGTDPWLSGVAGAETVTGCQAQGVQSIAKQYLGYDGQSWLRSNYSSNIDDKALHEIYVWPFAECVRAGASDQINNSAASQNSYTLNGILKHQLGFQGYVQTDWFAMMAGVAAVEAGTDQDMPGFPSRDAWTGLSNNYWSFFGGNLTEMISNGTVPEWRLDDMATRILTPYFHLKQDRMPEVNLLDGPFDNTLDTQRRRNVRLIREIAVAGTVLLRNENNTLPLFREKRIAVFGPDAGQNPWGPNSYDIPNNIYPGSQAFPEPGMGEGFVAGGMGSGSTYYATLVDPLMALQMKAREQLTSIDWAFTPNDLNYTAAIAQKATRCIAFGSSVAGEGMDRNITLLHNADAVIKTVADNCAKTIVVIHTVGPVDMEVSSSSNEGCIGGFALTDILYGDITPSGHLPYTITKSVTDYSQPFVVEEPEDYPQLNYTEGVLIDFRSLQVNNVPVRFPFGHGLSYTTFEYSNLVVNKTDTLEPSLDYTIQWNADAPGGDSALFEFAVVVYVTIRNTGNFPGTEITQLYLKMPDEAENPARILRGFQNIDIPVGQQATVKMVLSRKDISYWNVVKRTWVVAPGHYEVHVGASSEDIRIVGGFDVEGTSSWPGPTGNTTLADN